jgi:hypothetical protein
LSQLLRLIGGASLRHMSFKLGEFATLSSLPLKDSLLSLYSPFENVGSPWVET